jgi:hypothetical protein
MLNLNGIETVDEFLDRIRGLREEDWDRVSRYQPREWDEAWEMAAALGGTEAALIAMRLAAQAGARLRARALAGGAAAGLSVLDRLPAEQLETLLAPFGLLPVRSSFEARSRERARWWQRCPLVHA